MRSAVLLMGCAILGRAAGPAPLRIRVLVHVDAPASALRSLPAKGREIFERAGIPTEWSVCTPARGDCARLAEGEVLLKLVPRAWWKGARPGAFGAVLREGDAGRAAWIFYDPIRQAAQANRVSPGLLMGFVMAHEVGHLLGLDHALGGIMHCEFTGAEIRKASMGRLRFSADEARQLLAWR